MAIISLIYSAGKIHISEETKELLDKDGAFKVEERGLVDIQVRHFNLRSKVLRKDSARYKKEHFNRLSAPSCKALAKLVR